MKNHPSFPTIPTLAFILLSASLISLLVFVVYPNDFHMQSFLAARCANPVDPSAPPTPDFRLLIGVLTLPDLYERRHLVRHAYALQSRTMSINAHIDVRFVFCNLTKEEQQVLVAMEIMLYDDIMILNCTENMDGGKTYTYFSSLPTIFNGTDGGRRRPYDYVMKTDDDTYFRLDNLAESLRKMPREDMYYGFLNPCSPGFKFYYMSGMGYVLSWDLVEWIATSDTVRRHTSGPEDLVTGTWLRDGGRGKNRFDTNPAMYDYMQEPPVCFRHELVANTIAVHKLKDNLKWARTLKYFNVTRGLKPSKLYHIF